MPVPGIGIFFFDKLVGFAQAAGNGIKIGLA
jgi:hypothetical protein